MGKKTIRGQQINVLRIEIINSKEKRTDRHVLLTNNQGQIRKTGCHFLLTISAILKLEYST